MSRVTFSHRVSYIVLLHKDQDDTYFVWHTFFVLLYILVDSRRGGSFHPKNPPRNPNYEKHSRPPGRACHRTHATTKLPELLLKPRLPKRRQPRSWASLKKQFQEKVLPGGEFPRVSKGTPLETGCYGLEGSTSSDTAGVDASKVQGGEFVSEMKRCRYIRVPERYNGIQDDERWINEVFSINTTSMWSIWYNCWEWHKL